MTDPAKAEASLSDKADAAFQQATAKVIQRAKQTGTPVVVWEDDQVREVTPEQIIEHRTPKTESHDR
ncbi:MAG: hypothetical protein ACYC4N_26730 [Pirellulaceae bacterium]